MGALLVGWVLWIELIPWEWFDQRSERSSLGEFESRAARESGAKSAAARFIDSNHRVEHTSATYLEQSGSRIFIRSTRDRSIVGYYRLECEPRS